MNKIKTVKIKNPDGSISEESYNISIDAKNVDMENGKNLQEILGNIDTNTYGDVAIQLENLNNNVDSFKIDIKKKAYYFNNIADMKNANLKVGEYAHTLGYYEPNDGGSGDYIILNGVYIVDNGLYHQLSNGLYAQLIVKNEINVKQFGAYGDGAHDDTLPIQKALDTNLFTVLDGRLKITNSLTVDVGLHKGIRGQNSCEILGDFSSKSFSILKLFNSLYDHNRSGKYGTVARLRIENLLLSDITKQGQTSITHYGTGIELGEGCNGISFINVFCSNLIYGIYAPSTSWGVYNDSFFKCSCSNNDYDIYINCPVSQDCGENFRFINSSFSTSKLGNYFTSDMYANFFACSFDYNLESALILKDGAVISLTGCHIE